MKAFGPYLAPRTLREGEVRALYGVDRLTGMPALLYLLPHTYDTYALPELGHPGLLPFTGLEQQEGGTLAVAALPPASVPARGPELARPVLEALCWLHERGLVHGGITPEQLWASGKQVTLAGAGLPWGTLGEGFDAPEGGKGPAADLYALGRTLEQLGALPPRLRFLLSEGPTSRGSAAEALVALEAPEAAGPEQLGAQPLETGVTVIPGGELPASEAPDLEKPVAPHDADHSPASPVIIVAPTSEEPSAVEQSAPVPVLLDDSFDPISFDPVPSNPVPSNPVPPNPTPSAPMPAASPAAPVYPDSPRQQPVRIGWEEDHSWRVVKSLPDDHSRQRSLRVPLSWLGVAAGLVLLTVIAFFAARPATDPAEPCCPVTFELRGGSNLKGRLEIVRAPAGSGLGRGQLFGRVPGKVVFPNVPGRYVVRVLAEGYQPQTLPLDVPTRRPVIIEVGR